MTEKALLFVLSKWRLLLYALTCIVGALLLVFYSQDIGLRVFDVVAKNQEKQLVTYLEEEKKIVAGSVLSLSQREELRSAVEVEDVERIDAVLTKEKTVTGLTAYTVADENGTALTRAPVKANLGDNVFLTIPGGRAVAKGVVDATYGYGRNFPLTLGAGSLVKGADGVTLGAVFGGYWFDNNYAKRFKEKYLLDSKKREVVFYSKEDGVIGNSIQDPEVRSKFRTYISHASTLIQDGRSGDLINVNGKDYIVTNYLLDGKDEIYGGVLLLTPAPLNLFLRSMLVALIISFIFFISLLILEKVTIPELLRFRKKTLYVVLFALTGVVFISLWTGIYSHGKISTIQLSAPKLTIYNSVLKIRPGSGVYTVGHSQQVAIVVYSGGEEINAVQTRLLFDPEVIDVQSLSFNRSICSPETIIEQSIDKERDIIMISCIVLEKAFSDVPGVVADIQFTPIAAGNASISFGEDTNVLAADGLGTDVLRSVTSGFYRIFNEEDLSTSFSKDTLVIPFSPTHENSSRWYSSKRISVLWQAVEGAEYVYELSKNPTGGMVQPIRTFATEVTVEAPTDGVYYFKLAARKGDLTGLVSTFKINIDSTPPNIPLIKTSSLRVKKDDIVRFELSSEDDGSGLQKNFYVRLDDSTWLPTLSRLYMPFHDTGVHTVGVRVFDNAENYADGEVEIRVKK